MCIFSGTELVEVSGTNIYARMLPRGLQVLAYQMDLEVGFEVAMVLPIPVRGSDEDALMFIDLEHSPDMFSELAQLFVPVSRGYGRDFALLRIWRSRSTRSTRRPGSTRRSTTSTRAASGSASHSRAIRRP